MDQISQTLLLESVVAVNQAFSDIDAEDESVLMVNYMKNFTGKFYVQ